jgi:hypothetical protein
MSWIERVLEERLAQAARTGELSVPHLEGKPLADLDHQRQQGWWAEQFVARELSHDRRQAAEAAASAARAGFWRAESVAELRERVGAANAAITNANINLVVSDRLDLFDADDVESRWRALHPDT